MSVAKGSQGFRMASADFERYLKRRHPQLDSVPFHSDHQEGTQVKAGFDSVPHTEMF